MLALFAQGKGAGAGEAAGMFAGILAFYAVIFAIAIGIQVMFLLTMSRCFKEISNRNRQMQPGQVWLALIPIFGFVWTILMILRLSDSLRDEYDDRGIRGDGDYGKTIGIVYIVSAFICGPVALVCFIMYWVKVAGYTKELRASGSHGGYDDDEDDDRPRKRSRRRDEDSDDDDEEDEKPRRKKRRTDDDD